jgi:S-formylglutathione hydrolase FrmB
MVAKASIDTIFIHSNSMNKEVKTVVITPASYKKKKNRYPVVYLLHGAFGNSTNWANKVPELQSMVDEHQMIIVCPDGSVNSWYFDSPIDSSYRFETHVSIEVPNYIDANYRTIPDKKHRAIAGLSMGGHGAMFIAFRHTETFGACGSMSGALDVSLIKRGYDINKRLGDTITNLKYYNDWSVMKVMESYKPKDSLAIIMDCGLQDFIYFMSKAAHEKLVKLGIAHDYIERPGKHDWPYWSNAVRYQLVFFRTFFSK